MEFIAGLCRLLVSLIPTLLVKGQAGNFTVTWSCPDVCLCVADDISCAGRNLSYIPWLPNKTKVLDFSGNFLPTIDAHTFRNICNVPLKILSLISCHITAMTAEAFEGMESLEVLDISNNTLSLSTLRTGLLGLAGSAIRAIDVSSQSTIFKKFKDDMFDGLSDTKILNLSFTDGYLESVYGNVFSDLKYLEMLDLSDNYINFINLSGLHSLKTLDLSLNEFNILPLFKGEKGMQDRCLAPKLEILNMDNNHISQLGNTSRYATCLSRLKELYLRFNPLGIIKSHQFFPLSSLQTLNLDYLLVNRLHLEDFAFSSRTLKKIRLGVIRHILNKLNIFDNCSSLEKLELTNIRFSSLKDYQITQLFSPVLNLKFLAIRFAFLNGIPKDITEMKELEALSLEGNYIGHWGPEAFSKLTNLTYINLSNNRISVLNETSFPDGFLDRVENLTLNSNPYACTCDNYWFLHWAVKNKKKLTKFPNYFYCNSPPCYYNRKVTSYHPTFLECNGLQPYQTAILSTSAVLLVILVIALLYKKYKWHLRYYMYLLRSKKELASLTSHVDAYTYDAFVAYTADDRSWVIPNLMAVLEGEHGFKLCLHERDFLPGLTILDQISETIKHSRKVILVLSNNFAESQWCQYEILLAQYRLVEEGGSTLILIMLDDIKRKFMTNCLSMLLRTMTYIRWTTHSEGKKLFWNKVIMSMRK